METCKHRRVVRGWVCLDCHRQFDAVGSGHDAPAPSRGAVSGPSEAKADAEGGSGETRDWVSESVHASTIGRKELDAGQFVTLDELKTVALVQRMRDAFNLTYWTNEKREAYDAANAWLAQHKPPAPRWEPCAGQHVETKDGRWLVQAQTFGEVYKVCEGEHRRMEGSFLVPHWERKVS